MDYVTLGRNGVKVSPLSLGTMNFGPHTSEEDSHAILDRALDLGINYVDTADTYGQPVRAGLTEEIIGRWLKDSGRRDDIFLATKVFGPIGEGPNDRGLSAYHIKRGCEASLKRLGVECIDLYQMHHIDRTVPFEESWQALEQLIREGKILYVGSSNFAGWHIAACNGAAQQNNLLGLVSEQTRYNFLTRQPECEVLPACEYFGMGAVAYSPLNGGMFAGVLGKEKRGERRRQGGTQKGIEAHREQLEAYEELCGALGEEPATVALAWVLSHPVITAPIIGPRTVEQLESSIRAAEVELDDDVLDKLDEIWPGPDGESPECFAW